MQISRASFANPVFRESTTNPHPDPFIDSRLRNSDAVIFGAGSLQGTDLAELIVGDGGWTVETVRYPGSPRDTQIVTLFHRVSDDRIEGGGGADSLEGLEGADTLVGLLGADILVGGNGADWLSAADMDGSADTLDGGDGPDTLIGSDGDRLRAGSDDSNDLLRMSSGTVGAATLHGGGGADTLRGGQGGDLLDGGVEFSRGIWADLLVGGGGNDTLVYIGADTLIGGDGDDQLTPGGFAWRDDPNYLTQVAALFGGAGHDTITAYGAGLLEGGGGNDVITAGAARVSAGLGNDVVRGGSTVEGDAGADTLADAQAMFGQAGNDIISIDHFHIYINGQFGDGGLDADTLRGTGRAETLRGGDGDDLIDGTGGARDSDSDVLIGGGGADTISLTLSPTGGFGLVQGDGGDGADGQDLLLLNLSSVTAARAVQGVGDDPAAVMLIVGGVERLTIASDFERVQVTTSHWFLPANLEVADFAFGRSLYGELAFLANHAYSDAALNTPDGRWTGTGLRPVLAFELNMAAQGTTAGGDRYSFLNGVYQAEGAFGGDAEAVAHVYRARQGTFIAFRGTDSWLDKSEWLDVTSHYAHFQPLVDALKAAGNIGPVFITGHSLGGAMAQMLHADLGSAAYTVTFGSPGAPTTLPMNQRGLLTHVEFTEDIVPFAGPMARQVDALGDLLMLGGLAGLNPQAFLAGFAANAVVAGANDYVKPGISIRMADTAQTGLGSAEHDRGRYQDQALLIDRAFDEMALAPGTWTQVLGPTVHTFTRDLDIVVGQGRVEADDASVVYSRGRVHGDGNDLLIGGRGRDRLIGQVGNDTLFGVAGRDRLEGGPGADAFVLSWTDSDGTVLADFEPGDRIALLHTPASFGATAAFEVVGNQNFVRINIAGHGSRLFGVGDETWVTSPSGIAPRLFASSVLVEAITRTTLLAFSFSGSAERRGTAGADTLNGTGGGDVLLGLDGPDVLIGGSGAGFDRLDGGAGEDRVSYRSAMAGLDLDLARGTLLNAEGSAARLELGQDKLVGIEHADGGSGADTIAGDARGNRLEGLHGDDRLLGRAGDDTLIGGLGADSLQGDAGRDRLEGGGGADTLDGGEGRDTLDGGSGDDRYLFAEGDILREAANAGFDTVVVLSGRHASLGDHLEGLVLQGGTLLSATGNGLANLIQGNAGANRIFGLGGADTLTGGAGADEFRYAALADSTPEAPDLITDFSRAPEGRDRISLAGIDARTDLAGDDAFAWIGRAAFTGAGGELRFQSVGAGIWEIRGDVDGDLAADLVIRMAAPTAPAATWFVL